MIVALTLSNYIEPHAEGFPGAHVEPFSSHALIPGRYDESNN
jgi:hypothetical protein